MEIKELLIVVFIASAFILLSFFTKRIKPKDQPYDQPKFLRVFTISVGLLLLILVWFMAPEGGSIIYKLILSVFAANSIYGGLKGWIFKSKAR
jgi:FtsH-binding integral membrane protein